MNPQLVFIDLCRNGKLPEAQKLYNSTIGIMCCNEAFRESCCEGQIDVAKWLYSLGGISSVDFGFIFQVICYRGYIEMAKWLHSLGRIDIHADDDSAFLWSCAGGCVEIAKWLHSLGGINIHVHHDRAFRHSCREGHIEMVKWLHSLGGINVNAIDDHAFRGSCRNGHIEVVKWLLCDVYKSDLSSGDNKHMYVHTEDDIMTKIVFDIIAENGQICNGFRLSDYLVDKYTKQKQLITSNLTYYLIPDIADLVYYYV
jgi:hypothetical protein